MDVGRRSVIHVVIALLLGVALGVAGGTFLGLAQPMPIVINLPPPTATPAPLSIFVTGAVNVPGVYTVPRESRVETAIEAAGGFSAEADPHTTNLAAFIRDGEQLYVASKGEVAPPLLMANSPSTDNALINLNNATAAQLETIPGIGPATAQKIISYREDNGDLQTIEEIMNVSGIGENKFDSMRDFIMVD